MPFPLKLTMIASLLLVAPTSVAGLHAAELGRAGIEISTVSSTSVGARVRLARRWLLRPTVSYWRQTAENTPSISAIDVEPPVFETTDQYLGLGLGVGYEIPLRDTLRTSVTLAARRGRTDATYADIDANDNVVFRNDPLTQWDIGVSGGCEYAFGRSLAVFGEVGFQYRRGERFAFGGRRLRDRTWSTASTALGVVFYVY